MTENDDSDETISMVTVAMETVYGDVMHALTSATDGIDVHAG